MNIVTACPVCGCRTFERRLERSITYPGDELKANIEDINLSRNYILFNHILKSKEPITFTFEMCTRCGFILFSPRPDEHDLAIKYALMDEWRDTEYRDDKLGPPLYDDERAWTIHRMLTRYCPIKGLNVVDVGGANGYNLKCFTAENNCYVIDYGKREIVNGASYLCRSVAEIPDEMPVDLAICCHTMEHMTDPVAEMQTIRNAMSPGALLYVEVPFGCYSEPEGTKNFLTHLNFFSEGSLVATLGTAGFTTLEVSTRLTTYRWYRWLCLVAVAENKPPQDIGINGGYDETLRQINSRSYELKRFIGFQWSKFDRALMRIGFSLTKKC